MNDLPHDLNIRWIDFRNDAAEAAPGYAIMRVTGWDNTNDLIKIAKPNSLWSTGAVFAFNSPQQTAAGSKGKCTLDYPATVLHDAGTPALGQTWGPANGSWKLGTGNPGFTVLDQVSSGLTLAKVIQNHNSTKALIIRFTLPSALSTTDASKAGCTVNDYWGGTSPGASVTIFNLPKGGGNYVFEGASGAIGWAVYDNIDDKYWILNMQCGGDGAGFIPLIQGGLGTNVSGWSGLVAISGGAAVQVTSLDGGT